MRAHTQVKDAPVDPPVTGPRNLHPDDVYVALAETFRALADSTRAKLVSLLMRQEVCVGDLATQLGVTESAISQHLRLLRGQSLVRYRREGQHVYYTLADDHIKDMIALGLEHLGHTLDVTPSEEAAHDS